MTLPDPIRERPRSGFSLLELAVVMAIIALIVGTAAPMYGSALATYRVDAAARRIDADLAFARSQARATSTPRTVEFDVLADAYTIPEEPHPDQPGAYAVNLTAAPHHATIVLAAFDADGETGDWTVIFDGYGVPDSGGSLVVDSGGMRRTVMLDGDTGRATVQ